MSLRVKVGGRAGEQGASFEEYSDTCTFTQAKGLEDLRVMSGNECEGAPSIKLGFLDHDDIYLDCLNSLSARCLFLLEFRPWTFSDRILAIVGGRRSYEKLI